MFDVCAQFVNVFFDQVTYVRRALQSDCVTYPHILFPVSALTQLSRPFSGVLFRRYTSKVVTRRTNIPDVPFAAQFEQHDRSTKCTSTCRVL